MLSFGQNWIFCSLWPWNSTDELEKQYGTSLLLTNIIQCWANCSKKHAPLQERVITIPAKAPWYNSEIHEAKHFRRKLEHKRLKTKLEIDYDLFKQLCMDVNSLILDSKKTFYNDKIDSCAGDQKELFKIIDKIMHNYEEPQLPSHNSLDELLVKQICWFLCDKNFWNQKTGDKQFNMKHLDWCKNIFTRFIGRFPSGYWKWDQKVN